MHVYIYVYRSRHGNKMFSYLDDIEGELSASCAGLTNQVNDDDTGFGTDNSQSTPTLPLLTNGSQYFRSLFTTTNQKTDGMAIADSFPFNQQGYQQHHQQQYLQKQRSFQYSGIQLQLHQENSIGVKSGEELVGEDSVNWKHLKRKKLECHHIELNNDDACSEDEFIRKIATVVADKNEVNCITSVETLINNNSKLVCSTNNHESK